MKKRLIISSLVFIVLLAINLLLRGLAMPAILPEVKRPVLTLDRFMELVEKQQLSGVKIYRYAGNPYAISLVGQWAPTPTSRVTIIGNGAASEEQLAALRSQRYPETFLPSQKTIEEALNEGAPKKDASLLLSSLIAAMDIILLLFGIFVLSIGLTSLLMSSGGGAFRSSLRRQKSTVKLSEVAGCDEAKEEVAEIVAYLKDPERFKKSGGTMPKGVLLVGPPGTGKTMLAKAVANEANATFFSVDGSQFVEMFVGVGASRVRAVFEEARKHVPCIIFIDEIDSLAGKREGSDGGNREHNQTVNSLLVAMDGFATNSGVMVIAATNRPEMLDEAVLRPGRFDRKVYLELPDLQGRRAILDIHVAKKASFTLAPDVSLLKVAGETVGFSGADLANLLNEAALHAARAGRSVTQASDIDSARDKVTWGRERSRILSDADRKVIAYHEAGHALLHVVFKQEGYRLQKVTIVPRGRSLGSTHFSPERDIVNLSSPQAIAGIRCLMAGRVAEQVALGQITSGASGDIIESTKRIRSMVLEWAMSDMPFLAYTEHGKPICAPETLALAEKSVADIAEREYRATLEIVQKHRHALDVIAQQLLARETLSGEEVELICQTGHPFVPASAPAPTDGKPQTAGTPTRTSLPTEPPAAAIPPGLPGLACA